MDLIVVKYKERFHPKKNNRKDIRSKKR